MSCNKSKTGVSIWCGGQYSLGFFQIILHWPFGLMGSDLKATQAVMTPHTFCYCTDHGALQCTECNVLSMMYCSAVNAL